MQTISPEAFMAAGAHYGYSRTRRHPTVTSSIYGNKNGVDIINIETTIPQIQAAVNFLSGLAASGKTVLFVGVKPEARPYIQEIASSLHQPYVTERWIGGMLTNFPEIKKRIERLEMMKEERVTGAIAKYTKKEQLLMGKEMERLSIYFSGLIGMTKVPDAIVVVDSKKEHIAVKEARKVGIPVVAIGNTDCSIRGIDYPIVANDGTTSSIKLILDILKDSFQK